MLNRKNDLEDKFGHKFLDTGLDAGIFSAPGRVNIVGEHTDYNDGFVLPVAINRDIMMAAQLRRDRKIKIYSVDYEEEAEFSLDNIYKINNNSWVNYILGIFKQFQKRGKDLQGVNIAFSGNIPIGSGLSSSAALEVVTSLTISELHNININKVEIALLSQEAENEFVGVSSGIMDQYISALGEKDKALFIDCRTNQFESIPFVSNKYKIVMCDTRVKRELVNSEYNQRKIECEKAVSFYKNNLSEDINELRDVGIEKMRNTYVDLYNYSSKAAKRARHVITENRRVQKAVKALEAKDFSSLGQLMYDSHFSLSYDFEVSCKELDIMVKLARKCKGTVGARMTGAGFGGVTVNLVHIDYLEKFKQIVTKGYKNIMGKKPYIYISEPENGARFLNKIGEKNEY